MASTAGRRIWAWGLPLLAIVACASMLAAVLGIGKATAAPSAPGFLGEILPGEVPASLRAEGIAVDQKSGDSYLSESTRVSKFSPYGQFILARGKEVDVTKVDRRKEEEANKEPLTVTAEEEDICTAASGDDCSGSGASGSASGVFSGASGVAVERASGDFYVQESGSHRTDKFDSSGRLLLMFGREVNKRKVEQRKAQEAKSEPVTVTAQQENLCTASEECQAGQPGTGAGAFAFSTSDVAVGGPAGNERVYVGDQARIEVFNSSGEYLEELSLSPLSSVDAVSQLAADSSGNVFFVDRGIAGVHVAETNGGGELALTSTVFDSTSQGIQALAVGGGSLYVADGSPSFRVLVYEAAKPTEAPAQFAGSEPGQVFGTGGIAVDGVGTVYVTNINRARGIYKLDLYGSLTAMESAYGAPPATAPAVGSEIVHATVEAATVELEAQVDPEFRETTYQFEYGLTPCSAGDCAKAPAGAAPLGSPAKTAHQALVTVSGLEVGPTYYYRVTVANGAGTTHGPDRVFTVGASQGAGTTGLPDGRVYEQVTPPDKYGNEVSYTRPAFVAPDGDGVLYGTTGALTEGASNAVFFPSFVSQRTSHGWATRSAMPLPAPGSAGEEENVGINTVATLQLPSTDLSHLLFTTWGRKPYVGSPDVNELANNVYLEGPDPFAEPEWIGRSQIEGAPGGTESNSISRFYVAGASPDLKTIYFFYEGTLFPGASHLYEYKEGVLSDAGALPGGETSTGMAIPAVQDQHLEGLPAPAGFDNQVSADGSHLFFVRKDEAGVPELYARVTAPNGLSSTVLVSQSQVTGHLGEPAPDGPQAMASTERQAAYGPRYQESAGAKSWPSYVFASSNGARAFFQSADRLTEDAPADSSPKTYVFDLGTGQLEYLPAVTGAIVSVASDGSWLLFENTAHTPYQLERWAAGSGGGTVTAIAELPSPSTNVCGEVLCVGPVFASDDGKVVVFSTESAIPGFNDGGIHNEIEITEFGEEPGAGSLPNSEVFRYETEAGRLSCVSCPPKGVAPNSDAIMSPLDFYLNPKAETGAPETITPGRAISANGGEVFFETRDALVPQDTNGTSDTYEWEDGKVSLISSGHSPQPSYLVGISESGADAFFITAEGIAPGDRDGSYDIYDARIPRPGDNPPPEALPCEGAVCQGPPSVPNLLGQPASEAFNGAGNLSPAPESHVSAKSLTRAQKLARALRACAHKANARQRRRCEQQVRRKYGVKAARARRAVSQARGHNGRGK